MAIMLEEGKYYKLRNGAIVGPLKRQERFGVIFFSINGYYGPWWEHGGRYRRDLEAPDDIIEEIIMPGINNKQNNSSPVKTVTRKEIIGGNYGPKKGLWINTFLSDKNILKIAISEDYYTKEELKEFAQLLNEISEAI